MDLSELSNHLPGSAGQSERSNRASSYLRRTGAGPQFWDTRKERLALLTQAIETAVIPHMVQAHRNDRAALSTPPKPPERDVWTPDPEQIRTFAFLLTERDENLSTSLVESLLQSGIGLEDIHTKLFAGAALALGVLWECDDVDFAAVTLGLFRLHKMLNMLDQRFTADGETNRLRMTRPARQILLLPAPGEQHGFGLAMVAQFFRRASWDVTAEKAQSLVELRALVAGNWFDVVGFSLGHLKNFDMLRQSIEVARHGSRNPQIRIMVGGSVFVAQPSLAQEVGADATAADAAHAIVEAETLMLSLARTG